MAWLQLLVLVTVSVALPKAWGSALHDVGRGRNDSLGIYGGNAVSIQEAPYMAAIYNLYKDGLELEYRCGGSIIHKYFILTAAHCFRSIPKASLKVLIGTDNLEGTDGVFINVKKKICHQRHRYKSNDICLLRLETPILYGNKAARINLVPKDFKIKTGVLVNVTGWGATDGYSDQILRQTTIPIESQDSCQREYPELQETMLCAGSKGNDACYGDSGGPLTYNGMQVGIVSYGHQCGVHSSVYTRVSSYVPWIYRNIKKNL